MMKPKKLMIGIPFNHGMSARFHLSITNLAHRLSQEGVTVDINYAEGTVLSTQRNNLAKAACNNNYDLLMIDSDMTFTPTDAHKLFETPGHCVGGLYFTRRKPYWPLVFKENLVETEGKFRSQAIGDIPSKPFSCKAMGTGFLLVRHKALAELFSKWKHPFNLWTTKSGEQLGEDLSFFHRCNLMDIKIICVPNVDLGHITTIEIKRRDHLMHLHRNYHYCNDIEGWMTVYELDWLYRQAQKMDSIIEIGCWKGKSTHALLCGCKGTVYTIDHFKGSKNERDGPHKNPSYEEFIKNCGRFNNLKVFKMSSTKAAVQKELTCPADMIFIDGGHEYEEVKADLIAWAPKAIRLICGHDYPNAPGVKQAVDEFFGKNNFQTYESIWYKELPWN